MPRRRIRVSDTTLIGPHDAGFVAIIGGPKLPGESEEAAVDRKEAALREAFAAINLRDAYGLRVRLEFPRPHDRLNLFFAAMPMDSQVRLIYFLRRRQRKRT